LIDFVSNLNLFLEALAQLGIDTVPQEYIQLLRNFPAELANQSRSPHQHTDDACVSDLELLNHPDDIVTINLEARSHCIADPDGNEFHWPDQLLIIGENGEGDYYCLDSTGEHSGVLQYRHVLVEFDLITDSRDEYVELLKEAYSAGNAIGES